MTVGGRRGRAARGREACGALGEALQAAGLEDLAAAENPLGRDGARRLLCALSAGHVQHLNIR